MDLDEKQKEVVYTDAPKIIVASGGGAGKTRCLTRRLKNLLENGYDTKEVYAITYTNAAANELKSRLPDNLQCFVGTIHSLANRILLSNGIDTSWVISSENFDELFNLVEKHLDKIELPKVRHLLVDEFQDVCDNEYTFMFDLLKPEEFSLFGDASQSIFGWKGSNYKYFMNMIKDPQVKTFELNNNYRSGSSIIDFAENFVETIENNYLVHNLCMNNQYGIVSKEDFTVDNLITEVEDFYYPYKDIFILTRTNKEIEEISFILNKFNIPNTTFKKSDLDSGELNEALQSNSVKVLTVHSAKGLEAKKVIVLGVNCWNDEERRVCYVAATRAKECLIWMNKKRKRRTSGKLVEWE